MKSILVIAVLLCGCSITHIDDRSDENMMHSWWDYMDAVRESSEDPKTIPPETFAQTCKRTATSFESAITAFGSIVVVMERWRRRLTEVSV